MKTFSTILILSLAVNFYTNAQTGRPDPYPCNCERFGVITGGGATYPKPRPIAFIGIAANRGKHSTQIILKYSEPIVSIRNTDYNYQKLELPVMAYWNPTKNISIGGGVQGDLLLSSTVQGRKQDLSKEYKKYGFGVGAGAEIGAKNRGPRLGVHYIQHFGAGSTLDKSYSTLELTLRVQLGKKPQPK